MSPANLSRAGFIGLVAGLAGTATAIGIIFWPEHSAEDLFRHPFTTAEFLTFQVIFFLQHLGLVVLLLALSRSRAAWGRIFQAGVWLAVLGMVMFCGAELLAMGYSDADRETTNAGAMGAAYGVASVVNGLGMLVAGVGVVRKKQWSGWRRWTPLATGICLFVLVIPGLLAGFLMGRLVIAVWMLLFTAVGWSMHAESRTATRGRQTQLVKPVGGRVT